MAATAGVRLPIRPVKRQVFVLDTAVKPAEPPAPTVLPSGLCFPSETAGVILLGEPTEKHDGGFDFHREPRRFTELLWPEFGGFVPAFDTLKLVRGWAGLYDVNTLDGNALLGQWPQMPGVLLAFGFSGHGLRQAPAVGRYVVKCILGAPPTLDVSVFGARRDL